jgi:hypothetical protein
MPYPTLLAPNKTDTRYWKAVWKDCTVFVVKSGDDSTLTYVREYATAHSCPVVVVEDAFYVATWADVLFVSRREWWVKHQREARKRCLGAIVAATNVSDPRAIYFRNQRYALYGDPGADAVSFADFLGAKRVVLIGFEQPPPVKVQAELLTFSTDSCLTEPDATPSLHLAAAAQEQEGSSLPRPKVNLRGWEGRWRGKTVFVLASGPSLTLEDVEAVRRYAQAHRCPVVVTNTTFQLAPWADLLFFYDRKWWQVHGEEVRKTFKGLCATVSQLSTEKVLSLQGTGFNAYRNSGGGALSFAVAAGAQRVIAVGLDGKYAADGRRHWHKQHPKLGDAVSLPRFIQYFPALAKDAARVGVQILNASRDTALTCFPRVCLDDVLSSPLQPHAE